jgi:hypothetical protein
MGSFERTPMATIGDSVVWDLVPGAADYRVRVTDLGGTEISRIFTVATSVPLVDLLAGSPVNTQYIVYVAAKDVAGAGNGTPGDEAFVQFLLEGLPAPLNLRVE